MSKQDEKIALYGLFFEISKVTNFSKIPIIRWPKPQCPPQFEPWFYTKLSFGEKLKYKQCIMQACEMIGTLKLWSSVWIIGGKAHIEPQKLSLEKPLIFKFLALKVPILFGKWGFW